VQFHHQGGYRIFSMPDFIGRKKFRYFMIFAVACWTAKIIIKKEKNYIFTLDSDI